MLSDKRYPEILYAEELDAYLSKGWYRMGQSIFTTHFLYFNHQVYSAIWIRLGLEGYKYRKSSRKLMRRNEKNFQVKIRQGAISAEKEVLFQKYRNHFSGHLSNNLRDYLLDGEDYNIYNTLETAVYDEGKLVAFSFFDIGVQSAASIMGVYDPEYQKCSLGFYTMLMEIAFCREHKLKYYYPGYIVPGYSKFDYKLRIGQVEYLELSTNRWIDYEQFTEEDTPVNKMHRKLGQLQQVLRQDGMPVKLLIYPFFEASLSAFWQAPFLDYPLILIVKTHPYYLVISYDILDDCYYLLQCSPFNHREFYFNMAFLKSLDPATHLPEVLILEKYISSSKNPEFIRDTLKVKLQAMGNEQ